MLGKRLTLSDYDYSRGDINNVILWAARGLKFRGVSVSESFVELYIHIVVRTLYCMAIISHNLLREKSVSMSLLIESQPDKCSSSPVSTTSCLI